MHYRLREGSDARSVRSSIADPLHHEATSARHLSCCPSFPRSRLVIAIGSTGVEALCLRLVLFRRPSFSHRVSFRPRLQQTLGDRRSIGQLSSSSLPCRKSMAGQTAPHSSNAGSRAAADGTQRTAVVARCRNALASALGHRAYNRQSAEAVGRSQRRGSGVDTILAASRLAASRLSPRVVPFASAAANVPTKASPAP